MQSDLPEFHPVVGEWFAALGEPTDIQRKAWPQIAAGNHCLITAPTGSGKTLTAFLWALNRFITGDLATGRTRVLYVSPLKALNNDILNNLSRPLAELEQRFSAQGLPFPRIKVRTRSGDTDSAERRQMIRQPPEILITTPESLNLLLSSKSGLSLLLDLDTVIVDEIHAVVDNKRGAYLFSAVERLVPLSGEFQRIALSATVKPLEKIAEYVAGFSLDTSGRDYALSPRYQRREISIIESTQQKQYQVDIRYPEAVANRSADKKLWDVLAEELLERVQINRSTLVFVNNRALCEKLAHKVNHVAGRTVAYAHHGSLSKDIRLEVEQRLKAGKLSAIIATSSLEMGIDIGALDEVLLIQTAGSMASAIQRIGRVGHRVGETSKGVFYPTHAQDFLEAVVLARAVLQKDIEPTRPISCPLDVLAQVMISMTGTASWDIDELYTWLRAGSVYHELGREQFDLVINMLAGRYADQRVRELRPRISIDRIDNTVQARKGALLSLYMDGGVIPDRGYFQLRHSESAARIGELDEEFVWEAKIGQTFTLGTQYWQIEKITHNDVFVRPGSPGPTPPPFWKAESISRNFYFSERIGEFLETAGGELSAGTLIDRLTEEFVISPEAAVAVADFLEGQRDHTGCELPHRHHLLIESVSSLLGYGQANQIVLHTGWGAAVNRPWAMALEAAWRDRYGEQLEIYTSNESLVLQLPHDIAPESLLSMVSADELDKLLRQRLEGSGFFGARFRECASRAMLINRGKFNQRQPLWMSRLQSQKLLDTVLKYEDFPILLETWRDCLQDEFDLDHLRQLLGELESGEIRWSVAHSKTPSPMAKNIAWEQVNQYMYRDDSPKSDKKSNLRDELLKDLIFNPELRPQLSRQLCEAFRKKRQRLLPGYVPDTARDLLDWIKERLAIPLPEWEGLMSLLAEETSPAQVAGMLSEIQSKSAQIKVGSTVVIAAVEDLPKLIPVFYGGVDKPQVTTLGPPSQTVVFAEQEEVDETLLATLLANWLQFYGPLTVREMTGLLGVAADVLTEPLEELVAARVLVAGALLEDSQQLCYCDRDNFEILLYLARQASRPGFTALDLQELPLFLSEWQSLGKPGGESLDRLFDTLQQQQCYFAPAPLWEREILPARVLDYHPGQLDHIFQESDLHWLGREKESVGFCFDSDLDLLPDHAAAPDADTKSQLEALFPDPLSRYELNNLRQKSGMSGARLVSRLWELAWQGLVSNDTFAALRKGIDGKYQYPDAQRLGSSTRSGRQSLKRNAFSQWKESSPSAGNWYPVNYPEPGEDLIETEQRNKDRVRVLLQRYGILFRELLAHEAPGFQWRDIFRSLRLMELSREILSGYFFKDIPGPQFVSHEGLRVLQKGLSGGRVYWINAKDPLSFCGSALSDLKTDLPKRLDSNHIVYRGSDVVMVSERNAKKLTFLVPPTDPDFQDYLVVLRHLLHRPRQPLKHLQIETINGGPVLGSEYLDCLQTAFDLTRDHKAVILYRKAL